MMDITIKKLKTIELRCYDHIDCCIDLSGLIDKISLSDGRLPMTDKNGSAIGFSTIPWQNLFSENCFIVLWAVVSNGEYEYETSIFIDPRKNYWQFVHEDKDGREYLIIKDD